MASSLSQFEGIFTISFSQLHHKSSHKIHHKTNHRNGKYIRELGFDVVDDVASGGGAGHDGGVGDRGCVITEDTAAKHRTSY